LPLRLHALPRTPREEHNSAAGEARAKYFYSTRAQVACAGFAAIRRCALFMAEF